MIGARCHALAIQRIVLHITIVTLTQSPCEFCSEWGASRQQDGGQNTHTLASDTYHLVQLLTEHST